MKLDMNQEKQKYNVYSKGDTVYFTAFLKGQEKQLFICRGVIDKIPENNHREICKVKIQAISSKPIGCKPTTEQSSLLEKVIVKKLSDVYHEIPMFLIPNQWLINERD